jgi:hypothetical protein
MSIGRMMAGSPGIPGLEPPARQEDDFYPTPPCLSVALAELVAPWLTPDVMVWEPAAGDGALTSLLHDRYYPVTATDLVVRPQRAGAPEVQALDFLSDDALGFGRALPGRRVAILTNPPFVVWQEFAEQALRLLNRFRDGGWLVLVAKSTVFHAAARSALFEASPPWRYYACTWRPDFLGLGGPTMEVAVVVWRGGWSTPRGLATEMHLLHRPSPEVMARWLPADSGPLFGGAA